MAKSNSQQADTTKILTVRERVAIRKRNPGNPDVEALLAEGDALRSLLAQGSEANKAMQRLLDELEKDNDDLREVIEEL